MTGLLRMHSIVKYFTNALRDNTMMELIIVILVPHQRTASIAPPKKFAPPASPPTLCRPNAPTNVIASPAPNSNQEANATPLITVAIITTTTAGIIATIAALIAPSANRTKFAHNALPLSRSITRQLAFVPATFTLTSTTTRITAKIAGLQDAEFAVSLMVTAIRVRLTILGQDGTAIVGIQVMNTMATATLVRMGVRVVQGQHVIVVMVRSHYIIRTIINAIV